jgi:hypothetical protein
MTLTEAIKFMPSNQDLWISVMHVTLFRGSKDRLLRENPDWINDQIVNMRSSNGSSDIDIELKDSVYTRDIICEKLLEENILSDYLKMYRYEDDREDLHSYIKRLFAAIRKDEDIL